jgi:acyl-CoA synthetase (AMP-forming)/AMP-acid ligase II
MTFLVDGERQTSSLTFASLDALARGIAEKMLETAPGAKRALILQEPGLDFVLSLCACFYAGVAAVPTPPPAARASSNSAQRFARLLLDAEPDVILPHGALLARLQWLVHGQAGLSVQKWVRTESCKPAAAQGPLKDAEPGDLALIQYTSGSVAKPKGVLIDHANLAANLAAIAEKFALTPDSVVVNWLPPYHDMGLIGGILEGLWRGYRVVLMDPKHFIARPLRWLEAIEHFQADVSGGANFAYDLCADAVARGAVPAVDLSRWRLAYSGAEPVRASSLQRFAAAFAACGFRREAFYPCYGLAEATLMASGPEPGTARPVIAAFLGDALDHGQALPAAEAAEGARTAA